MSLYVWFTTLRSLLGQSLLIIILRKVLLLTTISLFGMRVSQMKIGQWFSGSLPLSTISIVLHEFSFGWLPTVVDCDGIILLKSWILFTRTFILARRGWLSPTVVPLIALIILTNV